MASNDYVKFLRGTPDTYLHLKHKDEDTLYFILRPDGKTFELYFGEKKLISNGDGCSSTTLKELNDVLLAENIQDKSLLMYNPRKQVWEDTPFDSIFQMITNEFVGATPDKAGVAGLVPVPKKGQQDLFLKADGSWSEPVNKTDRAHLQRIDASISKIYRYIGNMNDLQEDNLVGAVNNIQQSIEWKDFQGKKEIK